MGYILYRIETYGIKNLDNLMTFDFTNQTIDKKKNSYIKAIYGTNGTGKSAFIKSIGIYKNLNLNANYLRQDNVINQINNMINKKTKEFYFSIIYGETENNKIRNVYNHQIKIKIKDDKPYIAYEKLAILKDKTINGNYQDIYMVTLGELKIYCPEYKNINAIMYDKTKNVLSYSTLISLSFDEFYLPVFYDVISEDMRKINVNTKLLNSIITTNNFIKQITVFMDEVDINFRNENNRINSGVDIILKENLEKYLKIIRKLTKFLKIFKNDLIDIKIEVKEDNSFYYCFKKIVYDQYEIDSDYESRGIKKIMELFLAIYDVTLGKIVFIDELDNNINGVYLNKFIEYLNELKKGYLCFTTHNLYPMKYLYKFSNAIDFIGESGKVVSWKKNGNYRPYEKYPDGMIEDSPFNIEVFDFISVFETED